ncbi:MAG TPA: metal-sulfur cluster assembly factor [Lacunisphaera sp.]|nr:metal-sulfur cluster assembly factor [Lacunisphaera sp.]
MSLDAHTVWETLRSIPDPEFGINIVDLGLIYSVECSDGGTVDVTMTLTTPTCPSGSWIHEGAKEALARLPGATSVNVAMVFDPPWSPEMLSESAQRQLGRIP